MSSYWGSLSSFPFTGSASASSANRQSNETKTFQSCSSHCATMGCTSLSRAVSSAWTIAYPSWVVATLRSCRSLVPACHQFQTNQGRNLAADRSMITPDQPRQLHDANGIATTNPHQQRKQRPIKRNAHILLFISYLDFTTEGREKLYEA
jgi:hypothetical protein